MIEKHGDEGVLEAGNHDDLIDVFFVGLSQSTHGFPKQVFLHVRQIIHNEQRKVVLVQLVPSGVRLGKRAFHLKIVENSILAPFAIPVAGQEPSDIGRIKSKLLILAVFVMIEHALEKDLPGEIPEFLDGSEDVEQGSHVFHQVVVLLSFVRIRQSLTGQHQPVP